MRKLKTILKKHSGRDSSGKVVVRHQGGRHKRFYRSVDFRRDKHGMLARVIAIEYDPNRAVDVALVQYSDGEQRYILRPVDMKTGDTVTAGDNVEIKTGNAMPLEQMPIGTLIHNIELSKGRGGQIVRSAGNQAIIMARETGYVHVKLPSGEVRKIFGHNFATIGQLSGLEWKDRVLRKAGTSRHMGIRPTVRGVAQNPRSHPHGGGEARSGVGMSTPKTYAGRPAVGNTRRPNKYSDKYIVKGRKAKN